MDEQPENPIAAAATPLQRAKDTLLRALDQLEEAEKNLSEDDDRAQIERVHLVVVYEVGAIEPTDGAWHTIGGWSSTPGSKWEHAALLRRAAEAQNEEVRSVDDGGESD